MRTHVSHSPDVEVWDDAGFEALRRQGLDHVIDPMIYRVAEVYMEGRGGDPTGTRWAAIDANLLELITFFDLLVYSTALPMIDYGATFHEVLDEDGGFRANTLYDRCNDGPSGRVLYSVHVGGSAYAEAKDRALDIVAGHRQELDPPLLQTIDEELTGLDHVWRPRLGRIDPRYDEDDYDAADRRVATFLYGGVLFGLYADRLGAHVVQAKRARLQLEAGLAAVDTYSVDASREQVLLAALDRMLGVREGEGDNQRTVIASIPPVLPYLMRSDPLSPQELLVRALELRSTDMVREFVAWRAEVLQRWLEHERIDRRDERALRQVEARLRQQLDAGTALPAAITDWKAYLLKLVPVNTVWTWATDNVPGRGHVKFLLRLHTAARERRHTSDLYSSLGRSLRTVWSAA